MDHLLVPSDTRARWPQPAEMDGGDLKLALRQADKQQIVVRKVKQAQSWNSGSGYTAFEEPEPKPTSRVRVALRRQTQKLKQKTTRGFKRDADTVEQQLGRRFSFDVNDDLEKRHDPRFVLTGGTCQSFKLLDAKTQLRIVKAQQKDRRLAEKAAEKQRRKDEKELRKRLRRQAQEAHSAVLQPTDAVSGRPRRRVLKRTLQSNAELAFLDAERHNENEKSVDYVKWISPSSTPTPVSILGPRSPVSDFEPIDRELSPPGWRSVLCSPISRKSKPNSPAPVGLPTVVEHSDTVDLDQYKHSAPSELDAPNRPPEYVEVPAEVDKAIDPDHFIDLKEEPRPTSKASIRCDTCSATISLSSNFFYCNTCGPQGGLLCRGCMHDGKKCLSGAHVLESSKQLVRKACPRSESYNPPCGLSRAAPSYDTDIKTDETLAAINSEAAAQSLSLARLQKTVEKINSAAALYHKELVQHVKDVMADQRNETMQQVEYVLQEIKTERTGMLDELKQISAPIPPAALKDPAVVPDRSAHREDRQMALREREMAHREREMALEERRLARNDTPTSTSKVSSTVPTHVLALGNSATTESNMMHDILSRLKQIEEDNAKTKAALQREDSIKGLAEEVMVRTLSQLTIYSTTGIKTHAGTKRSASSAALNRAQATSKSTSNPFLRPPPTRSNNGFQDGEASDGESPKRHKRSKSKSPDVPPVLLACPFTKCDFQRYSDRNRAEKGYRGCSSCYITDISRLKQHLYRVHQRPEYYCARCFEVFKTKAMLDDHMRRGIVCETKMCPFPEKIEDEKLSQIRKKWPSKTTTESWYHIYRILFPQLRPPPSPYADELETSSAPSMLAGSSTQLLTSPRIVQDVVLEQLERTDLALPPAWSPSSPEHAFLVQFGQNVATEVLRRISASPTPITGSAPNSALPGAHGSPGHEVAMDEPGGADDTGLFGPDMDELFPWYFPDTTLDGQLRSDPSDDASGSSTGLSDQPSDVVTMPDLLDAPADDDLLVDTSPSSALRASCSKRSNDSGYGSLLTRDDSTAARGNNGDAIETSTPGVSTADLSFLDRGIYETLDRNVDVNLDVAGCFQGVENGSALAH